MADQEESGTTGTDAFAQAVESFSPRPDEDGRFNLGKTVAEFERGLGRTLTPDEYGLVNDRIFEVAVTASLDADYAETPGNAPEGNGAGTPGLAELVDAIVAEHPDWGAEQVKAEVLDRVRVAEEPGEGTV